MALLALVAGCAASGSGVAGSHGAAGLRAADASEAATSSAALPHEGAGRSRAAIEYIDVDGQRFPYPLLRVTVNGAPTRMIVDTGASHHVLSLDLAKRVGARLGRAANGGQGHAGEAVTVLSDDSEHIIEWWCSPPGGIVDVQLPSVFVDLEVGGIIAPARLADAGDAVVLDFFEQWLDVAPEAEALAGLSFGGQLLARCRDCACVAASTPMYVVPATVAGAAALLMIDSGVATTDLSVLSAAGRRLVPGATRGEKVLTAGGSYIARRRRAELVVGEVKRSLDVHLVPAAERVLCPRDGVLGMDVLADCRMALGERLFAARCR
jgi:hypothetical protein